MIKGIKVQIYPTKQQEDYLNNLFGCYRYVYNKSLELKINEYTLNNKSVGLKELGKNFTKLRYETEWLKLQNTKVLKQSILNMLEAYKNFYLNSTGFPKFKKKNDRQSVRFPSDAISKSNLADGKIHLIKQLKNIKFRCSDRYKDLLKTNKNNILSCTISKNKAGKYFCSFLVRLIHVPLSKANKVVGLDLGIKSFLVSSDDEEITNPKFTRNNEKRLKLLNKRLSKKQKGSSNRKKARLKLAKFYYKINCKKQDFLHQLSHKLVKEYDLIGIEDLNIKEMLKNHKVAKSIQELSLFEFTRQLIYKAEWTEKIVVKVGRYFASSKACSDCGWINKELKLSDRIFKCNNCNSKKDRDLNAAINIKNEALRLIGSRPPEFKPVETKVTKSVKQEFKL